MKNGFTLMELLIVIGVLSIITSAILISINPIEQFQKGRDAKRKNDLTQIQRALEAYYNDNKSYPDNTANFKMNLSGWDWGGAWQPYMQVVPKDSLPSQNYVYVRVLSGQGYGLYARLERGSKDPQACAGGTCGPASGCGQSLSCNYGVTSSNTSP